MIKDPITPRITISHDLFPDIQALEGDVGLERCRSLLGSAIQELARDTKSNTVIVIIQDPATGEEERIIVPIL